MLNSDSLTITGRFSTAERLARSAVLKVLTQLSKGHLVLVEDFGASYSFGDKDDSLTAVVELHSPSVYLRVLKGGSIGAAEAYMDGQWDSHDLTALTRLMAANLDVLDKLESKIGWLSSAVTLAGHWRNRNSRTQAKKNIAAHYDLGNDLYETFLDKRMLYSSALFTSEYDDLEKAQLNKMDRLCQELEISSDDHVVEIGTGWGAMAIYMATEYGCRVTTTTISSEQHAYVSKKLEQLGLTDRVTLLKEDYRDLQGQFDKLVSIEMIEAVGKEYLASYLTRCQSLLKLGGKMAIQAITITDQRYDRYSKGVDFIQKYIFPGGFLPSVTQLLKHATCHTDLVLRDLHDMGQDYAQTLAIWHKRFNLAAERVHSLGYDERFCRMWRYYLSYCEGGFQAKTISTVQLTFEKPGGV